MSCVHVVCACVSCQGSVPIIRSFICEKVPARSAAPAERGHAPPRLPFPKLKIRKTPSIIAHFFRWEQLNCLPLYCLHAVVHDRVSLSSCLVSPAHLPRFPTHYPLSSQPLSLLACPPGVIPLQSRASGVHCLVQCWCTTAAAPTAAATASVTPVDTTGPAPRCAPSILSFGVEMHDLPAASL